MDQCLLQIVYDNIIARKNVFLFVKQAAWMVYSINELMSHFYLVNQKQTA